MGLVTSGTKAMAQRLISRVAAGLPGMGPDASPEREQLRGGRSVAWGLDVKLGCLQPVVGARSVSSRRGRSLA